MTGSQLPRSAAEPAKDIPSEESTRFAGLMVEVRRLVDREVRAGNHAMAERHVDDALADTTLAPAERQRLMVVKLGTRGMRGDHRAMIEVMDQIIAVDPTSEIAGRMKKERPRVQELLRLGPDHPVFCETCQQEHPPGFHDKLIDMPTGNAGK